MDGSKLSCQDFESGYTHARENRCDNMGSMRFEFQISSSPSKHD